jgi:hypothetical protein
MTNTIQAGVHAGVSHLRDLLIKRTRTDRITGRPGPRTSWVPPAFCAQGKLGPVDLRTLTQSFYSIYPDSISAHEMHQHWTNMRETLSTPARFYRAAPFELASHSVFPGITLRAFKHGSQLANMAEILALWSIQGGSIKAFNTSVDYEYGPFSARIQGSKVYTCGLPWFTKLPMLWEAERVIGHPMGQPVRSSAEFQLVYQKLIHFFPELSNQITWLLRLAIHSSLQDEITRGFDLQVDLEGALRSPRAALEAALAAVTRGNPVDLKGLRDDIVPALMDLDQFKVLTSSLPRKAVMVVLHGANKTRFIRNARKHLESAPEPEHQPSLAEEIINLESALKNL